ncbi:phytoene synthase [Rhodovulum imhoffii]|uniref:Phytoene synthase n=1 Tax=Rhodovulum imhoffii TaxID=365340 RepID=A0A2T5BSJ7_9RHOB|nr:phytoene/squalene synthase family protein [Rhodovulum imhoffii]MBK5933441.1 phytoene synthase [Rhodovulum imhoffii]PTN02322.1 phytoene synthase [Rhodovulum imhoffii]
MIHPADLAHCEEAIRTGSLSFHAASRLLPDKVRNPALALYAFCRLADDAVDLNTEKRAAVLSLGDRLDKVYSGTPLNAPADRAFAAVVEEFDMPRTLPEALLEGLAWDAMERRHATLSDVYAYSARVASTVGAMMCVLMRVRCPHALARACDMGVAMQLTNIARDVGEDARARRIYLPLAWLDEAGIVLERFFDDPRPTPELCRLVKRMVADARRLYFRAETGLPELPLTCRPGMFAARHIYAGIAGEIARGKYDSINRRAHTSTAQKLWWLGMSSAQAALSTVMPRSAVLYAKPLPEVAFLVEAAADRKPDENPWGEGRAGSVIAALATLEAREREARRWAQRRDAFEPLQRRAI